MATKKEKNREKLQLLLRGWTYTMRSVVMKHVHESSLDRYNPWSLDDFLDTKKELVNQALSGQAVKLRMELKRPTVMKEWDVTLLYLILLEGCYPKLQQQYNSLDSDVKQIRIIRNELSHANSLEIEEVSYKKKSCQICEAISKGLTYINDTQYTTEMKTFMEEVTGQVELDTMISQFEDWLEKDPIIKEIEDALPSDEYDIRPTLSRMRKTYHGTTIEPVESILGAYKATKGYGRYTKLERLVLEGWLKTMRRVVMKHVFDSSPDKDNPLSLDVFLDNNKQLVKKTIAGRSVHDNMLKPPTDIEKWDVTLTCQILLEVCYRSPLIQQHYRNLQSDVRAIKDIRNLLSHIGSFEIEETSYKKMSTQVQKMISDGLSFVDDKEFTEEMNTFMNDVELESLDLDEAKSRFKEKTGIMIDIPLLQKEEEKNEVEEERYLTVNNYYLARRKRVKRRTNRDIDQHQQKFVKLVKQSEEIVNIISQQVEFETALKKEYPTLASEVKRHLKYIQDDRRVLVVAGDPGSGKKSLINLLLGAPILPVGQTPSLVGILKIWKGSLSVISQNESKKTPETKKNQDEAAEFIRNTLFSSVKTGIVTETEVCWPFESELLQDDVDIIVESGLGGETKAIEQHLPSSTAFIYVVDCGRAGGITTDRLRSIRTLQQLEPRRTIVLLNKWDVISSAVEKDCEDRKREIEQEKWSNSEGIVREAWKDIKPEYIMKTSVCQEIGRISPCIGIESDQTERVRAIIYSLLDEGADKIKTWMKSFCVFISKLIETHLSSVGKKQSQLGRDLESYNWIHAEAIAKSATLESEIQKHMEECSEVLSKEIAYHIRTNEFRTKMHNWTNDDFLCSLVDGDESVKHAAITTPFLERLSKIVVTDMKDEFGTFITNVRCGVHSKADVIVNLLKELKSILKNIDSIDSESADKIFDLALSEKNRLSHRLDDILNEALLASIFNSEQLLEPIHALSFIFEKPRKEGEIRLPPTEILKKTADDVIEALDTDKISTAIKEQLQTCKTEINQFATKVFPNITEILIPANKLFLMGTEKYDSMRKTIINVKGQVESFCTGCTSL